MTYARVDDYFLDIFLSLCSPFSLRRSSATVKKQVYRSDGRGCFSIVWSKVDSFGGQRRAGPTGLTEGRRMD
jgi:hypothetical protein